MRTGYNFNCSGCFFCNRIHLLLGDLFQDKITIMKDLITLIVFPLIVVLALLLWIVMTLGMLIGILLAVLGPLGMLILFILYCVGFDVLQPLLILTLATVATHFVFALVRD